VSRIQLCVTETILNRDVWYISLFILVDLKVFVIIISTCT